METPKVAADVTLRLERRIAAPPERVFAAWTTPEVLSRWFSPSPEYSVHVHQLDLRVGGAYRIEMRHTGGNAHVAYGTYREITAPRRLSFTWRWENDPAVPETLVTVLVTPDGAGTKLEFLHERFADAEQRDKHNQGWTGCLARLLAELGTPKEGVR